MYIFFSLIALGFLWGSSFALARYAMTHGLSPLLYTFFHILGPIILLALINLRWSKFVARDGCTLQAYSYATLFKHGKFFFVAAVVGMLLPDLNKFFLAQHLPSGSVGVITNTVPLFIYPLALLMREEPFMWSRFWGVIFGIFGIFLLVTGGHFFAIKLNIWALLALLSPLCYAIASVYIVRHNPRECSPTELCFGMLFYAAFLLLPLAIVTLPHQLSVIFTWNIGVVIILEIVLTTLGYTLLFIVLRRAGSVCYSLTDGIVAVTSLFWGALFFAEKLTSTAILGVILVLLGIAIVVKNQLKMFIVQSKQ